MAIRQDTNSGRNIRTGLPSPPSLRRANKTIRVRIYHRPRGSYSTHLAGHPAKSEIKGAKNGLRQNHAVSEREATRLDWMRRLRPMPHRRC
jgi:hypothetical protein